MHAIVHGSRHDFVGESDLGGESEWAGGSVCVTTLKR